MGCRPYIDKWDCMASLGAKPIGTYANIDRDTLTCRALHRLLVPSGPERHCYHLASHFSEEQGGTCIDRPNSVYNKRNYQCAPPRY